MKFVLIFHVSIITSIQLGSTNMINMVCNLLKYYDIRYKIFNLTDSAETPSLIKISFPTESEYDIPSGQHKKEIAAINKISIKISTIKSITT